MNNLNEQNKLTIKDLEDKLWKAADALRGSLSAEDYMHVVLGILTIKFINDKYHRAVKKLLADGFDKEMIDDDALEANDAFNVPEDATWQKIINAVGTSEIGTTLDSAVVSLGQANPELKGIFPTKYNEINKIRLGEVVKIFDTDMGEHGEDILGRIYEYFLGNFFLKRGQKGGEFYTPRSVVRLITAVLRPLKGKIYDPACGTGGMLVQAKHYIEDHGGKLNEVTFFGQESISTTRNLAKLNLILNGMAISNTDEKGNRHSVFGEQAESTFTNDQFKEKVFEYVMANPPFNLKVWYDESLSQDPRWQKYGLPPKGNANFAWLEHILYKLSKTGKAAVILANGSVTSSQKIEASIRQKFIEDNKIWAIISLPDKLFYTTGISATIWFLDNNKKRNDILFISAAEMGELIEKTLKQLTNENIEEICEIFNDFDENKEINIPGIAKTVPIEQIKENDFSLFPGQYIEIKEDEAVDKEELKKQLEEDINELFKLLDESKNLEQQLHDAVAQLKKEF